MTIAVLGPGAVGGALAVPLVLAGSRVICVAPQETAAAIAHDGLTLDRRDVLLQARPEATAELQEPVDLLLVTVKAPALEDALGRVRAAAAVVLPLMNGLEHMESIRGRVQGSVVAGSVGRLEAFRDGPSRVVQTTRAPILTVATDRAELEPLRDAGFEVRVGSGERSVLWEKVVRLAPLAAATVLTHRLVGELRADPDWRPLLETAIEEACAIAAADGVELSPAAQWEIIDSMPASLTTSTARDVAAGRPSELDAIAGGVVRAGRRLGVPTPTLERLFAEAEEACQASLR